tara:strand:- start:1874 stop:2062 length:189 start_codon:yes stop_codon:yes gene_type:complete
MEIIWIISHIVAWGVGIITGIYFSSQIEKHINKNIVNETIKEELDNRKQMDIQDQIREYEKE